MTKDEVFKEILEFLMKNPKTQVNEIRKHIEGLLKISGKISQKAEVPTFVTKTTYVRISDNDVLLINEIIWDLLVERILTPGINKDNLDWPWLNVSNLDKLQNKLKDM